MYRISEIAIITDGELLQGSRDDSAVKLISTDSRNLSQPELAVFFALKGDRHNGHAFIREAYDKGVRNFVVEKDFVFLAEQFPSASFVRVAGTIAALQLLAAYHRRQFRIPVIGITGSNGKTIVKEWLYQLLHPDKNIVRSPKSFNSQVGVPLSVWQMNQEHELALFEAGISMPGEMEKLQRIILPSVGIFTNIGQAHDENFSNVFEKVQEKLKLFKNGEVLLYNKDSLAIHEQVQQSSLKDMPHFTWSRRIKADLQIGRVSKNSGTTEIQGIFNSRFISISIPFTDDASVENAIHCWALMLYMKYDNATIAARMLNLSPVAMRLELKQGINGCSVINDSYNSDLGSLSVALDFLDQQKQHPKKTLIISDILQSGKNEESLYREVAELVSRKSVNRIIGIGEAISRRENDFQLEKAFYQSTREFLDSLNPSLFQNEAVLIKGARAFGFEEISKALQKKAHDTVLEINLNALAHNLNYFRSRLEPGTKIMAMVKAFSYGSGSHEIANVLQFQRVDYLAVAYADEGVELRNSGITLPIMVMNPDEHGFSSIIRHRLEPEIYSFRTLSLFAGAVGKQLQTSFDVHIKLDTGMHRLGFEEKDMNELIVRIKNHRNLRVKSVFSHLAAGSEPEHDAFTREQIGKFTRMSGLIASHFDYPVLRHISNTSAFLRFPEARFDMVRIGAGLYGIGAGEREQSQLKNVSTLKTIISQIKEIPAGETIGYSRKGVARQPMKIATVPIGYADGLSRSLGNGKGKMIVNGQFSPIVGNVCMDMCMIDITGIPAGEGDEVIVFGEAYPIQQVAKDLETISYEVLTNVSGRVKRVYYQE